jgi:hypothetical protein
MAQPFVVDHRGYLSHRARLCERGVLMRGVLSIPRPGRLRRVRLALLAATLMASAGTSGALPALAAGEPTLAPNRYSTLPGLPDGRVYEESSPADKDGNAAGAYSSGTPNYSIAAPDGNSVLFEGSGAFGTDPTEAEPTEMFIAKRTPAGWTTISPDARHSGQYNLGDGYGLEEITPAADLSHVIYAEYLSRVAGDPEGGSNLYLSNLAPLAEPAWLAQPTIPDPSVPAGKYYNYSEFNIVGGTSDFSTVYFGYSGTLIPEDESRAPYAASGARYAADSAYGLYEWTGGTLKSAAVLPDGSISPFGAVPAGSSEARSNHPYDFDNQVSQDGSKLFFLSPDPGQPNEFGSEKSALLECKGSVPGGCVPELYVRETLANGTRGSVLVSRDTLLPEVEGQPASAPHGAIGVHSVGGGPEAVKNGEVYLTYGFASPDGSQVFFESADKLARSAAGEEPAGTGPWAYDFDTDTNTLTYLPGVTDGEGGSAVIAASSRDGSRFFFNKGEALDMWSAGQVTTISQHTTLEEGRSASDGSVFVFWGTAVEPAFNSGGFRQVYRYDVTDNTLGCVSCPPAGVVPTGEATFSHDGQLGTVVGARQISEDGERVFFSSPDPLVPQDTNGRDDVYEWENGTIFLISSGTSLEPSYYLDSSTDGSDVFFTTAEGLVPGDTDGSWDVYDARIQHPGDSPPPAAVPCQGDVCQGPPSVPQLLEAPSSETFSGLGNIAPQSAVKTTTKTKAVKKKEKKTVKKKAKRKSPKRKSHSKHEARRSSHKRERQ